MQPYPSYKSTGLDWLPQVPEHWEVLPNIACFTERNERERPESELLAVTMSKGVIRQVDMSIKKDISNQDKVNYKRVCVGDIAYNKMRMWQGAVGKSEFEGIVSPAYVILTPRPGALSDYFHLLFRTPLYQAQSYRSSYGICLDQLSLRYYDFKRMLAPLPPLDEQRQIVAYLEAKRREIDLYIAAKRAILAMLKELSTALIARAVTRGLNPHAPMKPSGVEWLGDVPAHWEVRRLSHIASELQTGPFGSQLHSEDYVEGGIPVINPSHMREGLVVPDYRCAVDEPTKARLKQHELREGDIVFARRGELGRCALITEHETGWLCGTGSLRIRPKPNVNSTFLVHLLGHPGVAQHLTLQSVGSTMDNLNTATIAALRVPLPPLPEQAAIVRYIQGVRIQLDEARSRAEQEVQLGRELWTTLVAQVVTGHVDVRTANRADPPEDVTPALLLGKAAVPIDNDPCASLALQTTLAQGWQQQAPTSSTSEAASSC